MRALASEFNETVARLDALIRSQQEFVADASHQLRTPLAALRLRLENLERDVDEDGKPSLEAALAEVSRLARLVDGLLALARADASRPSPSRSISKSSSPPASMPGRTSWPRETSWCTRSVRRHRGCGDAGVARAGARQPALATRSTCSHPADRSRSRARTTRQTVELHVRDNGPGMTAEQRARALDRFWRAGPPGSGTGLGLAIVHRLVTADGGSVDLREADGGGLDVVLRLPAAPERTGTARSSARSEGARDGTT